MIVRGTTVLACGTRIRILDHDPQVAGASAFPAVGITRGKKLVVLIGQKKAPGIAVRNDRPATAVFGVAGES
jgi:hypothetical protein